MTIWKKGLAAGLLQTASAMVALQRLGLKTAYAGRFGSDEDGRFGLRAIEYEGVNLDFAEMIDGADNQIAFIMIDSRTGERTIIWDRDERLSYRADEAPIELAALTKAFRRGTQAKNFCAIGTAKTNVGHLDVAAGVTGLIKQTPNSIGYVELIYAAKNNIAYGAVKNASGAFVKADLAGVSEAAAGAAKDMPDDFRVSITNAPGKKAYPIASFTWLLIPAKFEDAAKRDAMKNFLKWAITDGQKFAEDLDYAKLPKEVVAKEMKAISSVQ